ncbi:hypothetical protein C1646_773090 [Rhizophagus diaphanus]|nr:hypothetical protein C1646_773090 [Rhizophagus diaphanus] [Rhizophagus sp. MUCL 43196]
MASNDKLLSQYIKTEAVDSNKSTDSFVKLKVHDYVKNGLNISVMRFLFDGICIKDNYTPDYLEMEDDDDIYVVLNQLGC